MEKNRKVRMIACLCVSLFLLLCGGIRLLALMSDPSLVETASHRLTVRVAGGRGQFYDCNGLPLTGQSTRNTVTAAPTPAVKRYLSDVLIGQQKQTVLETLERGKPAVFVSEEPMECPGLINTPVPVRYTRGVCTQLIGYVDEADHGVCGLEKELDEVLYNENGYTVQYDCDAAGRVLAADEAVEERPVTRDVRLTIDANIQQVCRQILERAGPSAAVVRQVGTGKIKAMVSLPDYDVTRLPEALTAAHAPLINRCLTGYSVGSVFKTVVAAAGLEQGSGPATTYRCTGRVTVEGHDFHCHQLSGHGVLSLEKGIAYSCNAFFYQFGMDIGAKGVWEQAGIFGLGRSCTVFGQLCTAGEQLPELTTLENSAAALANLSIGQGSLLASPLLISGVYEAIANGGVYHQPVVVEGIQQQGVITKAYPSGEAVRGCSPHTADALKQMLVRAVAEGTGVKARPYAVEVAGKTATAQTGWVNETGQAVEHAWFCGFFPVETPRYVVCIMVEDNEASPCSPAALFAEIADGITGLTE